MTFEAVNIYLRDTDLVAEHSVYETDIAQLSTLFHPALVWNFIQKAVAGKRYVLVDADQRCPTFN